MTLSQLAEECSSNNLSHGVIMRTYMSHYQNFEPPFPIPDSWEWVRLEDIAYVAPHST